MTKAKEGEFVPGYALHEFPFFIWYTYPQLLLKNAAPRPGSFFDRHGGSVLGRRQQTPDKIKTLADWLNVSAQWLRFGISEERPVKDAADKGRQTNVEVGASPTEDELLLLSRIRAMPEHRRCLVVELVEQLSLDQEMWRS